MDMQDIKFGVYKDVNFMINSDVFYFKQNEKYDTQNFNQKYKDQLLYYITKNPNVFYEVKEKESIVKTTIKEIEDIKKVQIEEPKLETSSYVDVDKKNEDIIEIENMTKQELIKHYVDSGKIQDEDTAKYQKMSKANILKQFEGAN